MLSRIMLGLSIAGALLADSASERSLKTQSQFAAAQNSLLIKANADLRKMNDALIVENNNLRSHSSLTVQVDKNTAAVKEQTAIHSDERGAVEQAQADTAQTLTNTSATNKANLETEQQMLDLAKDLHTVVRSQASLQWLLLIQTLIVLGFTGVIWYMRRPVVVKVPIAPSEMLHAQDG